MILQCHSAKQTGMTEFFPIQNSSNFEAHYRGTGPEIWKQTRGNVDAFVSGAGKPGPWLHVIARMSYRFPQALADPFPAPPPI